MGFWNGCVRCGRMGRGRVKGLRDGAFGRVVTTVAVTDHMKSGSLYTGEGHNCTPTREAIWPTAGCRLGQSTTSRHILGRKGKASRGRTTIARVKGAPKKINANSKQQKKKRESPIDRASKHIARAKTHTRQASNDPRRHPPPISSLPPSPPPPPRHLRLSVFVEQL